MQSLIDTVMKTNELVQLVQKDNFVGWIYSLDYDSANVITNDLWKRKVKGIPHNCFLVATTFNPDKFSESHEYDREVILLRVTSNAELPQDRDLLRTKIDFYQNQTDVHNVTMGRDYDKITKNMMQFSGLKCRVLGTFCFGSQCKLWR